MAFIPRKTIPLIITLVVFIIALIIVRLNPPALSDEARQTQEAALNAVPQPSPTVLPTFTPRPAATVSATPAISPTPAVNPRTGWHIYQNQTYNFSFDYPPAWTVSEFSQPQPIVLVGSGEAGQITAFSVTLKDWPFDDSFQTATPSAFSHGAWQGTQSKTTQDGLTVNVITATQGMFRFAFVESGAKTSQVSSVLVPILNSFNVTPNQ